MCVLALIVTALVFGSSGSNIPFGKILVMDIEMLSMLTFCPANRVHVGEKYTFLYHNLDVFPEGLFDCLKPMQMNCWRDMDFQVFSLLCCWVPLLSLPPGGMISEASSCKSDGVTSTTPSLPEGATGAAIIALSLFCGTKPKGLTIVSKVKILKNANITNMWISLKQLSKTILSHFSHPPLSISLATAIIPLWWWV